MKKTVSLICALALILCCAACAGTPDADTQTSAKPTEKTTEAVVEAETMASVENAEDLNVLVVYFDVGESVGKAARLIAEKTGGDLFEIKTENDYSAGKSALKKEIENGEHPVITGRVEDMSGYSAVFAGCADVDGELPMAMVSFLEEYDLRDKVIIPFVLSGEKSLPLVTNAIDRVSFGASQTLTLIFGENFADADVTDWLTGLGF